MIKTIKKSWRLFAKIRDCNQSSYKAKNCHAAVLRIPFSHDFHSGPIISLIGLLPNFIARVLNGPIRSKDKNFLAYLPGIFVVCIYVVSSVLILFFLNFYAIFKLAFIAIIGVSAARHIVHCYWALNLREIVFDVGFSDFYSVDRLGNKQSYTLLEPTVVIPSMVILNFRKSPKDPPTLAYDSNITLAPLARLQLYLRNKLFGFESARSQSLVITLCSVSAENFRQLRIFLLSRSEIN